MPTREKQQLETALGLKLTAIELDWEAVKAIHPLSFTDEQEEEADRLFFTWQHFRGEHRPQSCLLDADGHVRGLIINETKLTALTLPALPGLEYLCVFGNEKLRQIKLEGEAYPLLQYLEVSENALEEVDLRRELPLLQYLSVRKNQLRALSLPDRLPKLEEVDASENQLQSLQLPDAVPALQFLFLRKNKLTQLVCTASLAQLRTLDLSDNQLTELPRAEYTRLETLRVEANPLAGFGEELIKGDESGNAVEIIAALRSFAETGEQPNYRAKLIIVGNGRIGKTCLVKRLRGQDCDQQEVYTHGISISELTKEDLPEVHTDELYLNVWDFGGQEVFYATHQFFMSEEAAYIYAWTDEAIARANWERDEEKAPQLEKWRSHEYWLANIRMHGQESPLQVVKTHCLATRGHFPAERLRKDYAIQRNPVDFDAFSAEARYLTNLKAGLTRALNELPLLGQPQPKGFYNLTEYIAGLRADGGTELSKTDFDNLVGDFSIPKKDADAALSYLRKTGEVIHFPASPRLRNKIYVDPGVLTERIYRLIENNTDLTRQEGEFAAAYAQKKLGEDWEDLLELLINFQLVYRKVSGGNTVYIAPQYLPRLPAAGKARTLFDAQQIGKSLRYTLRYPRFLPENVMVNVLSEYGPYAIDAAYRDAIFFCREGETEGCLIKADEDKRLIEVYTTATLAGNALAREVFDLFLELSKKASLHVAAAPDQWVVAKNLAQALDKPEMTSLPPAEGEEWVEMVDFAFLRGQAVEQVQLREVVASIAVKNPDRIGREPKSYPKPGPQIRSVNRLPEQGPAPEWKTVSPPIQVLFAAASPMRAGQMNTGKESRLKDLIKEFDQKRRMVFKEEHGLNVDQFRRLLFTEDPHIIHFAGHGEREGLVLEDQELDAEVLIDLVADLENTRILVLNACYTLPMAERLARHVPYVIGTQGAIPDATAIAFANDLYVGLAAGQSVRRSFKFGLNGIKKLPGAHIPVLCVGKAPNKV